MLDELEWIDFLIRTRTARLFRQPQVQNDVVVIRNGDRGKYAGILHIRKEDPVASMKDVSSQYQRINFSRKRLAALAKEVPEGTSLEEYYADDQTRLKLIQRLRDEQQQNLDLVASLGNGYYYNPIGLDATIADDPEVAPIVKEFLDIAAKH